MWGSTKHIGNPGLAQHSGHGTGERSRAGQHSLPPALSRDEAFAILENRRRRRVLELLHEGDGSSTLSELAERIAAMENGIEREAISSDQRKRVYIGLYQRHLPKMDDAGIIDYNQRSGDIQLTESGTALYGYLEMDRNQTDYWSRRYLAVAGVGVALLLTGVGAPTQASLMPQWLVLAGVIGSYLCLSSVHLYRYASGEWANPNTGTPGS